ncbi:hypothetical protein BCR36DRAFT_413542 [Piromyces finnis]|uniref:Transforming acidic coiled-coil-containing protein C-terminal domain-containing protein n=1 Tax=Piromyces finnis TaxID=1754191 RepID=A0A1Y1V5A4_9FUNG|nr:hypothetical protein BCR36DRAFT_413542 [Piromyces finnis]|eukprot:ORX47600.1 hypothetical protein BCR36DRAFT_413542 [Piromyces finnis]
MEKNIKINDNKKLKSIFNKNKRSNDIIGTSTNSNNNVGYKQEISNRNENFKFENDDFINKFLSDKMNSLNISENSYIISYEDGSNENNNTSNYEKPDFNDNIFINETLSLKNNTLKHSDFDITINNITSNTENFLLSSQINNIKDNKNMKNRQKKDKYILSDLKGSDSKIISNNNSNPLIDSKKKIIENDEKSNYALPNDNIDLLFKKKINKTSFLDGLESDNNLKPMISSFHKKSPSIHSCKSEPNIETDSIFKENLILNTKISKTPNFKPAVNYFDSLNEREIYDNKFRLSGGRFDNYSNKNFFYISKEISDLTEEMTDPIINKMNQSIDSADSVFEFDILNSNNISHRISFIKEKYLDIQNSNKNDYEKTPNTPIITIDNSIASTNDKYDATNSRMFDESQNVVVINNNDNSEKIECINSGTISIDPNTVKYDKSQSNIDENIIADSQSSRKQFNIDNSIRNTVKKQNINNNISKQLSGNTEFQKFIEIIQKDKTNEYNIEVLNTEYQNINHLNEDDIPIKEGLLDEPQNDGQINEEEMQEQLNNNEIINQIKDYDSKTVNDFSSINVLKTKIDKIETIEQDIVNNFYSECDKEFNEYLSKHYDIDKTTKIKNKQNKNINDDIETKIDNYIEEKENNNKNNNLEKVQEAKESAIIKRINSDDCENNTLNPEKSNHLKQNNDKLKDLEKSKEIEDIQEKFQQFKLENDHNIVIENNNEYFADESSQKNDESLILNSIIINNNNNSKEEVKSLEQLSEQLNDQIKDESKLLENSEIVSNKKNKLGTLKDNKSEIMENIIKTNDESKELLRKNDNIYEELEENHDIEWHKESDNIEIQKNKSNKLNNYEQDNHEVNSNFLIDDKLVESNDKEEKSNEENNEFKIQDNNIISKNIKTEQSESNSNLQQNEINIINNIKNDDNAHEHFISEAELINEEIIAQDVEELQINTNHIISEDIIENNDAKIPKEEKVEFPKKNENGFNINQDNLSMNSTNLVEEIKNGSSSSSNVSLYPKSNFVHESIPKSFSINYPSFSEIDDSSYSFDNCYDERNSDSVITLFEPNLEVDSSDVEYVENDNLDDKDIDKKDSPSIPDDYIEQIKLEIQKKYEKEIQMELNKKMQFEENYYKSLSKQEMIKDTLDEYELTITQMIDDTNKIKEKNNIQIEHLVNEINRLKRESEVMSMAFNEIQSHYNQMNKQNIQFVKNKKILQDNIDSLQNDVLFANQRCKGLLEHVESKIKVAHSEINKEKERGDQEISIYEAKIRKTQLNNESLQGMYKILKEEYDTKTNENMELVEICDSLVEQLEAKNNENF